MRRSYVFNTIAIAVVLLVTAIVASAQTEPMRGSVKLVGADGKSAPVSGAVIDVYRTDMKADYHTKSDKKGEWVFAGLPFVGTYVVSVSAPGASPSARAGVKARGDQPIEIVLSPGDGKKLTEAEAVAAGKGGSAPAGTSGSGESAADKAKAAEIAKANEKVVEENKKIENSNKVVGDAFKNGNAALLAKNYDEAIRQYDTGLAADPEHPGAPSLLTNKSVALRTRAVDKYNAAIMAKDDAAKTAGIASAKEDFSGAAEAATKAVEMLKKNPGADPAEQKQHETNKYFALAARAEAMRLFAMKVDQAKGAEAAAAFGEYEAVETDPAKKTKAEKDYAELLFQTAGDQAGYEKAIAEFQKILEKNPDDADALLRVGQALFNIGALNNNDKAKYQEASNYLQRYVDKAPESQAQLKAEAKELIATMKQQANITPEKTKPTTPPRKRP